MIEESKILETISMPIFENFKRIYLEMAQINVEFTEVDEIDFHPFYTACMGLNGVIDVNGKTYELEGGVLISWREESYLKMSSNIMGEEYTEINEEIDDVGLEILNTTIGNSKRELGNSGVRLKMSLPVNFVGDGHKINTFKNIPKSKYIIKNSLGDVIRLMVFFTSPN